MLQICFDANSDGLYFGSSTKNYFYRIFYLYVFVMVLFVCVHVVSFHVSYPSSLTFTQEIIMMT